MIKQTRMVAFVIALVAAMGMASLGASVSLAQGQATKTDKKDKQDPPRNGTVGAVFAMTNETAGNEIVIYSRAADGTLERLNNRVRTRGLGIGVDTDTQGPLRLSPDNRFLYAVNPGSDNLSVFEVNGTRLRFLQIIEAGDQPLSLTISGNLLYVLAGSVAEQGIHGFRIAADGTLTALPNSYRMLSSPIAVPGEIRFSPDGRVLLVTQKTTNVLLTPQNAIDAFTVGADGYASATPIRNASFGLRPFSLDIRRDGKVVVVEAFNAAPTMSAASSYQLSPNGTITVISGSVPNGQTDVCWVLITNDGRYVFAANFGSGTISSYSLSPSGTLTLINGVAASLGEMSQPVDIDLSADGRYLYQLLRGTGAVSALRIDEGGRLTLLQTLVGGLPVADGASGIAAY